MESKRIQQKEIAEFLNVTPNTVNNYFNKRTKIDIDTLVSLAKALDVNICSFFDENLNTTSVKNYQRGQGNTNEQNIGNIKKENNTGILEEKIKSLEAQLKLKDEIIELLRK